MASDRNRGKEKARILPNDMDQSRRDTINELSAAEDTIGPIPDLNNDEIDLVRCFTSKDNPAGTSKSNVQFQRDLTTMIRADIDYYANPTLGRLCEIVASIMHTWERLTAGQRLRSLARMLQLLRQRRQVEIARAATDRTTHGCHADFDSIRTSTERAIRVWDTQPEIQLPWKQRVDGNPWNGSAETPNPKKRDKDKPRDKEYYGSSSGNNDGDSRGNDGGGKGGGSRVHFDDRSRGTLCRTDIVTHLTCNCGGSDINSTYHQCLVSLATSSTHFTALTLFDTGTYTSFVNRGTRRD